MTDATIATNPTSRIIVDTGSGAEQVSACAPAVVGDGTTRDPIFAVITEHRIAIAADQAARETMGRLACVLPAERMRSEWRDYPDQDGDITGTAGVDVVEGDDPRWIAAIHRVDVSDFDRYRARERLLTTPPATLAGAAALLTYITSDEFRGNFPSWRNVFGNYEDPYELIETLAKALPRIVAKEVFQ